MLKKIKFITGTTGSKINNLKQVGIFDKKNSKFMTNELSKKKIFLKDHNCDFLNKHQIFLRKKSGVCAFNIGPELACAENKILYEMGFKSKNKNFEKFFFKVINGKKWLKWCNNNSSKKTKFISSAHYFYGDKNYLEFKKSVLNFSKFNNLVIKKHLRIYNKFF